jgi:hypothetical protein
MAGDIGRYISDHSQSGACAFHHYQGDHDNRQCRIPEGYCAMNAYMVVLLKNAEQAAATAREAPLYHAPPKFTSDALTDMNFGWRGPDTPVADAMMSPVTDTRPNHAANGSQS